MSESNTSNIEHHIEQISIKIKTIDSNEFKIDIAKNSLISDLKKHIEIVILKLI